MTKMKMQITLMQNSHGICFNLQSTTSCFTTFFQTSLLLFHLPFKNFKEIISPFISKVRLETTTCQMLCKCLS
uniref:Uncharacterized protein n=1 Tax=Rhizophora mucronata TaxID=61149 RepID=A0A2P2K698_RHIMU